MLCPKCKIEAAIGMTRYETKNDDNADIPTELYIVQDIKCRNPSCTEFGKIVYTARNPIQLSKDTSETEQSFFNTKIRIEQRKNREESEWMKNF